MPWIDGYRAYLAASRAAATLEPAVHAAQLAAFDREAAIAARARDAIQHGALGGDPFELVRAAWIDRVVGHARIAATFDDPWGVKACSIELSAALVASSPESLRDALVEVSARAHDVRAEGVEAIAAFARLVVCLVRMQGERRPTELGELRRDVGACARLVATHDRLDLERLEGRPRHRWRIPWVDTAPLARWLAAVAPSAAADGIATGEVAGSTASTTRARVPDDAAAILCEVEAQAERWRAALANDTRMRPAPVDDDAETYAREAAALPARLEACRAALRAMAVPWLGRQRTWPEPILASHARRLVADAERAPTPTAIDLVSMHAASCLAIEATWWQGLASAVTGPLRAALVASYEPSRSTEAALAAAREVALALVGVADPWTLPWLEEIAVRNLLPHATGELDGVGAYEGEACFDLLHPWRTWTAISLATSADLPLERARALTRSERAPIPERRRVRVWDREVALDELDRATLVDARPPVAGFAR